MSYKGGKAVASGGYGCVFKPSLKCKGKPNSPDTISKLMFTDYANSEYDDILKFSTIIKSIDNYKKYFIIEPIEWCHPEPLSIEDKINFDKKCSNFTKKGINSVNVNSKLTKLRLLNMPDGGIDLDEFFKHNVITNALLHNLNEQFKDLLTHAILPMNKKKLYHLDIKSGNILIDKHKQLRIVDWGLAGLSPHGNAPDILRGRPVQYNCPFSSLLINNLFKQEYRAFLAATGDTYKLKLKDFVINYYDKWSKHRGIGHEDYIEYISKNIFMGKNPGIKYQSDIIKYNITKAFIYNFLIVNLETFTKDGEFQEDQFIEVFLFNADIWGLLMCYEPIFFYARKKPAHITISPKDEVLTSIMNILFKYCFDNPAQKIPVSNLIVDINNINALLKVPGSKTSHKPIKKIKHFRVVAQHSPAPPPKTPSSHTKKKRSRCPNGTRKSKKPPPICIPK